jgi:hypothetical protein
MASSTALMVSSTDVYDQIEEALADLQPFGDCEYIFGRLIQHYRYRLRLLGEHTASANVLLSALDGASEQQLHRVLGDPAVRVAIDSALAHIKSQKAFLLDEVDVVLSYAAANLVQDARIPPLAEGSVHLYGLREDLLPWIWTNERVTDDPLGNYFRRCYSRRISGLELASPMPSVRETLDKGAKLLARVCPRLSQSALGHVHLVAVPDTSISPGFSSLTTPAIPGLVVLAPLVLKNPLEAAEYLLHESMHCKYVDLEHTHSLMCSDYNEMESPRIRPHWNRAVPGRLSDWSINRSMTVCHVYTTLAFFYSRVASNRRVIERFNSVDATDIAAHTRRSLDRAQYLQQQLLLNRAQLGAAGILFVEWLGKILSVLDPLPRPRNSYVHLALDLYEREAEQIQKIVERASKLDPEETVRWSKSMRNAAGREIKETLRTLSMLQQAGHNIGLQLRTLSDANISVYENATFHEVATFFLKAREAISRALRSIPPENFLDCNPERPSQLIGDAVLVSVEESGRELDEMLSILVL